MATSRTSSNACRRALPDSSWMMSRISGALSMTRSWKRSMTAARSANGRRAQACCASRAAAQAAPASAAVPRRTSPSVSPLNGDSTASGGAGSATAVRAARRASMAEPTRDDHCLGWAGASVSLFLRAMDPPRAVASAGRGVPFGVLRRVHALVGALDELLQRRFFVGGPEHDAQAHLELVAVLAFGVRGGDAPLQALGELLRRLRLVLDQHHELVAAGTRHHIGFADRAAKHGGDVAQSLVSLAVAEAVVDVLEAVQVEEQHVEAGLVTPGAAHGVLAEGEQAAPVVQAGQVVRQRERARLLLAAAQRCPGFLLRRDIDDVALVAVELAGGVQHQVRVVADPACL